MRQRECSHCKHTFIQHRSDQVYCSGECRSKGYYAAHREQAKARAKQWATDNAERVRKRFSERYYSDPDALRERSRRWRAANRERHREYSRQYNERNPHVERRSQLAKYGLTPDAYDAMLAAQGGCCALCQTTTPSQRRPYFDIDHCHTTNRVRGLLCERCNRGLGLLGDDPATLLRAATYLRRNLHASRP